MAKTNESVLVPLPEHQPSRVVLENVRPEVDGGRFPIKRTLGEEVEVTADIHADGHDQLAAVLRYRRQSEPSWTELPMQPLVNDAWSARFCVTELEPYLYTIEAWVDHFATWHRGLGKKIEAEAAEPVDLLMGAELVSEAGKRANGADAEALGDWAAKLRRWAAAKPSGFERALDEDLAVLVGRWPDRRRAARYPRELTVWVDRERARFSTWYELFPRSCTTQAGRHGTFKDVERRLRYVAEMGFDVLYLPPIHPIGRRHRKGKNNKPKAARGDHGSPWAIGAKEGGHKSIHPELGTLQDFRRLLSKAGELGIEVALDLAFQCAPDHPYVEQHPEWFRQRPDGTVQYAENPPKKYEDIYPIHFETEDWRALWEELLSVVRYWIEQGVRIFRVDNPHTKPFRFWEWLIGEVRREHPDVIFLAEAFTRPKIMHQLAKLGFTQSYTYFAWRNTKWELTQYFTELSQGEVREFFRPNAWPNTPDILTEYLQYGGRGAFMTRLSLAATLAASYGVYGPAFELGESRPREPGSEEYLDSEKYEIRHWDIKRSDSLRDYIALVNRIRRENPALHSDWSLRFHPVDNEQIIAYSKSTPDGSNTVLVVANLDPHHLQTGFVELPVETLGLDAHQPYQVHDLLTGARYFWSGPRNYVALDPASAPVHILRVRRRVRTERDFDYFL
jgi:starch synthase (maltosyl-transferring)